MWNRQDDTQVEGLEGRVARLDERLDATLGVLALMRPSAAALTLSGVQGPQLDVFYQLIDDMTQKMNAGVTISYAEFEERMSSLVPARRGDRRFFQSVIEALKLERPDSLAMLEYLGRTMALFSN